MNNNYLEINTTGISSICSKYNELLNNLELDYSNVINDFKPLLNCGVLSSYIPDLKDNIDKVVLSAKEMVNYLKNFAEEQEKIDDNSSNDNNNDHNNNNNDHNNNNNNNNDSSNNGGGQDSNSNIDDNSQESIEDESNNINNQSINNILTEEEINILFDSDEFMKSLLSIVTKYPDIIFDLKKKDLLKELLVQNNITDDNIVDVISNYDSKVIQTTLKNIINGEIEVPNNIELITKIRNIVFAKKNNKNEEKDGSHKI